MIEVPHKDCLLLVRLPVGKRTHDVWIHAEFQSADYEGPMWDGEDIVTLGHGDRWMDLGCDDEIDMETVLAWAELPTVGERPETP